jgi:phage terminase large subunit
MKLSQPQQTIANNDSRFKVVVAGRRFGKTYLSMREICYRARIPNQEIFYITTSYRAAKMILWKPLKRRLMDLRWAKKVNESELSILLKNGTTISLKGSEDPDKLRGVSLSYVVIDEAAECKLDELWGEIIRPALADQQGGALFIGTPKGKSNSFYDLYISAQEPENKDWSAHQYTTLDGGFVKQEEIDAAKQDMSERQFRQEFLATFESYENLVAWAFDRDVNIKTTDLPTDVIHVGMDFNVNPSVCSIMVRSQDDMYAIDEILMYSSNTNEMAEEIKNRYPRSKVFVYPDPSGSQRKTSANGQTDHTILQNAGFIVKAPRKHDPVRDRINAANARLRSADTVSHAFIAKSCKYTIESLEKHSFKAGTMIPDKETGFDHMFDAWSYCLAYLFPLRRSVKPQTPQRWTVR